MISKQSLVKVTLPGNALQGGYASEDDGTRVHTPLRMIFFNPYTPQRQLLYAGRAVHRTGSPTPYTLFFVRLGGSNKQKLFFGKTLRAGSIGFFQSGDCNGLWVRATNGIEIHNLAIRSLLKIGCRPEDFH